MSTISRIYLSKNEPGIREYKDAARRLYRNLLAPDNPYNLSDTQIAEFLNRAKELLYFEDNGSHNDDGRRKQGIRIRKELERLMEEASSTFSRQSGGG